MKTTLLKKIRGGVENARAFGDALFCAVRLVNPSLPGGGLTVAVLEDGTVFNIDDFGDLSIDRMYPGAVGIKKFRLVGWRRLRMPVLRWSYLPGFTMKMYGRIKRDRAGEAAGKAGLKGIGGHGASLTGAATAATPIL